MTHSPRVLFDTDIETVPHGVIMSAIRGHLIADASGQVIAPPRHYAGFPTGSLVFTIGGNASLAGFRAYETFSSAARAADDQIVAVWDQTSCRLKGVAVGHRLGALRTGALGGIAADILAPRNAAICGVVGSGLQAEAQIRAIAAVRKLEEVRIFSPNPKNRVALADRVGANAIAARPVETARQCVEGVDIVVLATSASVPVIEADWVSPTAHVSTLGPKLKGAHELPLDLAIRAATIASDSPQQIAAQADQHMLHGTSAAGRIVHLGNVATDFDPDTSRGMTLYLSAGLAGSEVVALDAALRWLDPGVPESQPEKY